jgi:lactate dehydrogenase-like 2-hydroxyacid dehydrogenase
MPDHPTVLITRRLPEEAIQRLPKAWDLRYWDSDEPIPRQELLAQVEGVSGILCLLTERMDGEVMERAGGELRVVSTMSVGYDHVDVDECRARGVPVGNTPDVLTETTAELAVALLLATARRIPEGVAAVKEGAWDTWKPMWLTGQDIYGSTLGIVGLGRIGATFGAMMQGFGCRLIYSGPSPKPAMADPLKAVYRSFDQLLAESDFLSIHCPLTPETRHLFNGEVFSRMKPNAILINTSRGGVVDQDALYTALTTGQIQAAGLDVTDPEPLPPSHPLLSLNNCVILPHIGSATVKTRTRMAIMAVENLLAGVQGDPLPHKVI